MRGADAKGRYDHSALAERSGRKSQDGGALACRSVSRPRRARAWRGMVRCRDGSGAAGGGPVARAHAVRMGHAVPGPGGRKKGSAGCIPGRPLRRFPNALKRRSLYAACNCSEDTSLERVAERAAVVDAGMVTSRGWAYCRTWPHTHQCRARPCSPSHPARRPRSRTCHWPSARACRPRAP